MICDVDIMGLKWTCSENYMMVVFSDYMGSFYPIYWGLSQSMSVEIPMNQPAVQGDDISGFDLLFWNPDSIDWFINNFPSECAKLGRKLYFRTRQTLFGYLFHLVGRHSKISSTWRNIPCCHYPLLDTHAGCNKKPSSTNYRQIPHIEANG